MTFREKIVRLRKMKSLTQDEFATAVGVSRQAVYKWESGQSYPEVLKLIEIKMLFGISIDDLLDDTYEIEMPEKKKKRISRADKNRIEAEVIAREEEIASATDTETAVEGENESVIPDTVSEISEAEVNEVPAEITESPVEEAIEEAVAETAAEETIETTEAEPVAEVKEPVVEAEPAFTEVSEENTTEPAVTENAAEEIADERPREKRGFFQRLFGKK